MRWLRPDDRQSVPAGNKKEALARRRRTIVSRTEQLPFNPVAERAQNSDETLPALSCPLCVGDKVLLTQRYHFTFGGDGTVGLDDPSCRLIAFGDQRSPLGNLPHVFERNDARTYLPRPAQHYPGQGADFAVAWLSAGGLAVVSAIRRGMQQPHRTPLHDRARVEFKHVRLIMPCLRMVGFMHRDGIAVVIAGNVRADAGCHVHCRGHAAATREQVNEDFLVPVELVLQARIRADTWRLRFHEDCRPSCCRETGTAACIASVPASPDAAAACRRSRCNCPLLCCSCSSRARLDTTVTG